MAKDVLEEELGRHLRSLRVDRRLTQEELADRANVSLGALKRLEQGLGSTTTTLTKVLRAMGQERWIEALGPPAAPFSPLDILTQRRHTGRRGPTRVRSRREDR